MPSDDAAVPPSAGPVAGKYELVRLIGRGGMGAVWEGRHATLGTRVAIKFIDAEYAESPEARTRFDNEARAAATIQSKHAIQIFDHGVTDDGKPYIVMELLLGEPLDQRLDRVTRLSLQETARILRQVSRALARAHERGIVHRDLKPENIFLVRSPDDDEEIAKVLDFGIAKFKKIDGQTTTGNISSSTKTGAVIGTPFYMSPEQARGLREIDHRSDLWSIGVIAFKCTCGILPFEGVSIGDLLVRICTTPAPVPSSVVPGLPPPFDAWFARALEKEPARRFQSATELADALAYAAGLSVKKASMSTPPTSEALAATVPSTRVGPLPSTGSQSGNAANATSAPFTASSPRAAPSSKGYWIAGAAALLIGVAGTSGYLVYGRSAATQVAPAMIVEPARGPDTMPTPAPPGTTEPAATEKADAGPGVAATPPIPSAPPAPTAPHRATLKPAPPPAPAAPSSKPAPPKPAPKPAPSATTTPTIDPGY
jgi:serine/threonine-protein kinase